MCCGTEKVGPEMLKSTYITYEMKICTNLYRKVTICYTVLTWNVDLLSFFMSVKLRENMQKKTLLVNIPV